MNSFELNNGVKIPAIGLGTFPMRNDELRNAVKSAASVGYNSFDTASAYRNAEDLCVSLKENFTNREDFFITTKLSNTHQRTLDVRTALTTSLKLLGLDYVDLYLMHWPNSETYLECYSQMESLYKEGLTRAIGVCNFHEHHLNILLSNSSIVPGVNQIELHPLLSQEPLVEYCTAKGIIISSYSPFARMHEDLINNDTLIKLALKYNKKVTQIIMRWNFQKGYIAIPKSSNIQRQRENIDIFNFELCQEDMILIDSINRNFRVRHNPDNCDFNKL